MILKALFVGIKNRFCTCKNLQYLKMKAIKELNLTKRLKVGRVAERLERLPTALKTTVRDPPRAIGWTLAHCPPSSEWGPGGNTEEIKAVRKKELATLPQKADGPGQVSSLTGTSPSVRIVHETLTLRLIKRKKN